MPAITKQDIITSLEREIEGVAEELTSVRCDLDEAVGMNDRLNKTLTAEREKIGKLKDVARFFRAQRDRVDAYLSAVLDMQKPARTGLDVPAYVDTGRGHAEEGLMKAQHAVNIANQSEITNRPRINEPGIFGNGRDFAAYRDNEPQQRWEDF